jgi:hypothetical protein
MTGTRQHLIFAEQKAKELFHTVEKKDSLLPGKQKNSFPMR